MARSGVSIRYRRAELPMIGWLFPSKATTEGTRLDPSSPGITTGVSPCINATSEFVVPRSMPTMRSSAISLEPRLHPVPSCGYSSCDSAAQPSCREQRLALDLQHLLLLQSRCPNHSTGASALRLIDS